MLRQKARQASVVGAGGFHAEVSFEGLLLLQPIQELPEPLSIYWYPSADPRSEADQIVYTLGA